MYTPLQPRTPPSNHACPPATTHAPSNHACPHPPVATMHTPPRPPATTHIPGNHACPPATTHAPQQPRMLPLADRMTHTCKNITLPQTSFAGGNNDPCSLNCSGKKLRFTEVRGSWRTLMCLEIRGFLKLDETGYNANIDIRDFTAWKQKKNQ